MAFRSSPIVVEVFQSLFLVPENNVAVADKERQSEYNREDDEEASEQDSEGDNDDDKNKAGDFEVEEVMLPNTEHRKFPSKEIMENLESKDRVSLESYIYSTVIALTYREQIGG
jgi:uncharacterized protein Veg